jgi:hypothetical protein
MPSKKPKKVDCSGGAQGSQQMDSSLYVEPYPWKGTTVLILWKYENNTITRLAEYIYWPTADEDEPNFWLEIKKLVRVPVLSNGKLYKNQRFLEHNWVLKSPKEFPEAFNSYIKEGIRPLEDGLPQARPGFISSSVVDDS